MRNLLRAFAVCALTLVALSTANAATLGNCLIRCTPPSFVTISTTQAACCGGQFPGVCPGGGTGFGIAWNNRRC